jgi:hypothetical protein
MANTTNFGWETPDDTDLVKDGAAAIRTLGSAIDTSMVDLKGGTTGQVLSKTSNTDMDFTWVTSDDANAIQNAIVDAKGDLITATAADTPARLAVGTNGQVLTADSTTATGLKWATAAGGGLKSYTLLNAGGTALTGSGTVTVSGISNQQALLILVSNASSASASSQINVRINTDTAANYNVFGMEWQAAAIARDEGTGATQIPLGILANNAASQLTGFCHLFGTNSSSGAISFISNGMANAGGGSGQKGYFYSGWYDASAAVSSISIVSGTGNLDNGTVYVYGMAA